MFPRLMTPELLFIQSRGLHQLSSSWGPFYFIFLRTNSRNHFYCIQKHFIQRKSPFLLSMTLRHESISFRILNYSEMSQISRKLKSFEACCSTLCPPKVGNFPPCSCLGLAALNSCSSFNCKVKNCRCDLFKIPNVYGQLKPQRSFNLGSALQIWRTGSLKKAKTL